MSDLVEQAVGLGKRPDPDNYSINTTNGPLLYQTARADFFEQLAAQWCALFDEVSSGNAYDSVFKAASILRKVTPESMR